MTKDNIGLAALLEVKQENEGNKENSSSPTQSGSNSSSNKQLLLVSTAHIHWDPEYCDVKLIQTLMLINELKTIIEQAMREFQPQRYMIANNNGNRSSAVDCSSCIPVVLCADLNSLPESGVIEYLRSGRILANHVDFKDMGYDSCLQKMNTSDRPSELSHNLKLECAYDKEIIPYTNYT
jgi:CCR4-NOT transcription complex subunit 6